jgi:hypothetical protein
MYAHKGNLIIKKGFLNFDTFYFSYSRDVEKLPNNVFVIHFRLGTGGVKSAYNCHPFKVNSKLGFVHNGIFSNINATGQDCDTMAWNKNVLQQLPDNFIYNHGYCFLLEQYLIENASKAAFLDNKGNYLILNKDAGSWDKGFWFSNKQTKTDGYHLGKKKKKQNLYDYGYGPLYNRYEDSNDNYINTVNRNFLTSTQKYVCDSCGFDCKCTAMTFTDNYQMCDECVKAYRGVSINCPMCGELTDFKHSLICSKCCKVQSLDDILTHALY